MCLRDLEGKGSRIQIYGRSVMEMEIQVFLNPTGRRERWRQLVARTVKSPRVFSSNFK